MIIVVAAGNNGGAISAWNQAVQEFDNIVLVGAADGEQRASYSDVGLIDIVAPGGTPQHPIISTVGNSVGKVAGTSVSAAFVTGAISQVQEANPGLNYCQVIDVVKQTAKDLNTPGYDIQTGNGLLDSEKAIALAKVTQPGGLFKSVPNVLGETWQSVGSTQATEREAGFFDNVEDSFKKAADEVAKTSNEIKDNVNNTINDLKDSVTNATQSVIGEGVEKASEVKDHVVETVKPVIDEGVKKANEVKDHVVETAKPIIDEGVKKANEVKNDVVQTVEAADQKKNELVNEAESTASIVKDTVSQGFTRTTESSQKEEPKILWGDSSDIRKAIRDFGSGIDEKWDKTKKEWDKTNPLLGDLGFTVDVGMGMSKAALEMVDGLGAINDFSVMHSPQYYIAHPGKFAQDWRQLQYTYEHPEIISKVAERLPGAIWDELSRSYIEDWNNEHPGQAIGRGIVDIGSFLVGAGEIGEIGKGGKIAEVAGTIGKEGKIAEVAGTIGKEGEIAEIAGKGGKVGEITGNQAIRSEEPWKFLDPIERRDYKDAISSYERISKTENDASQIARHYDADTVALERVKQHVFEELPLYKDSFPDGEIVAAWDRLSIGKANKADQIFLQHELMESDLVHNHGMPLVDSHQMTEEVYNWSKALKHYKNNPGKFEFETVVQPYDAHSIVSQLSEKTIPQFLPAINKMALSQLGSGYREIGLKAEKAVLEKLSSKGTQILPYEQIKGGKGFDGLLKSAEGETQLLEVKVDWGNKKSDFSKALGKGYGFEQTSPQWTEEVAARSLFNNSTNTNPEVRQILKQLMNDPNSAYYVGVKVGIKPNQEVVVETFERIPGSKDWKLIESISTNVDFIERAGTVGEVEANGLGSLWSGGMPIIPYAAIGGKFVSVADSSTDSEICEWSNDEVSKWFPETFENINQAVSKALQS